MTFSSPASSSSPVLLDACACGEPVFRHRTIDGRHIACETLRLIDQALQASTPQSERPASPCDATDRPFQVGDALPLALDAHAMARAFGVSLQTIYDWRRAGKLRKFELRQPLGSRRWSGKLLQQFLDGGGTALAIVTRQRTLQHSRRT